MKQSKAPKFIYIISVYLIIVQILVLYTYIFDIIPQFIKAHNNSITLLSMMGILIFISMIGISIYGIIAAINLFKLKEFGRRHMIVFSWIQILIALIMIILFYVEAESVVTTFKPRKATIDIVLFGFLIFYLHRKKDVFLGKKEKMGSGLHI